MTDQIWDSKDEQHRFNFLTFLNNAKNIVIPA